MLYPPNDPVQRGQRPSASETNRLSQQAATVAEARTDGLLQTGAGNFERRLAEDSFWGVVTGSDQGNPVNFSYYEILVDPSDGSWIPKPGGAFAVFDNNGKIPNPAHEINGATGLQTPFVARLFYAAYDTVLFHAQSLGTGPSLRVFGNIVPAYAQYSNSLWANRPRAVRTILGEQLLLTLPSNTIVGPSWCERPVDDCFGRCYQCFGNMPVSKTLLATVVKNQVRWCCGIDPVTGGCLTSGIAPPPEGTVFTLQWDANNQWWYGTIGSDGDHSTLGLAFSCDFFGFPASPAVSLAFYQWLFQPFDTFMRPAGWYFEHWSGISTPFYAGICGTCPFLVDSRWTASFGCFGWWWTACCEGGDAEIMIIEAP